MTLELTDPSYDGLVSDSATTWKGHAYEAVVEPLLKKLGADVGADATAFQLTYAGYLPETDEFVVAFDLKLPNAKTACSVVRAKIEGPKGALSARPGKHERFPADFYGGPLDKIMDEYPDLIDLHLE
jgi:hypothetical protein